jgi:hypothetical protein
MELAIINGTYRDGNKLMQQKLNQILIPNGSANPYAAAAAAIAVNQNAAQLRSPPNHIGQPLIISPRLTPMSGTATNGQPVNGATLLNGTQLLADPNAATGLYYTTIPTNLQAFYPTEGFQTLDYPGSIDLSQAGMI